MVKLTFFVRCNHVGGGYENVHYFESEKEARAWAKENDEQMKKRDPNTGIDIVKIETVSLQEFAKDYMGDY